MLHRHPFRVNATELPRRRFLHLAAGAAALPSASRIAWAQAYPNKPVRLIVGAAAGGPQDTIARLMGQWLSEWLGQQFIIENRAGAGGTIAAEAVVRAPPDGYTLLSVGTANAVNTSFYDKLKFNFISDIAPVAGTIHTSYVMAANLSVPAKTIPEFIAYAKANPGKISMASAGIGTGTHMTGELFKMMTGVNMLHVPYRGGGPALIDLLAGQVQIMFDPEPNLVEPIKSGRVRALAVTTAIRSEALPDVPTMSDFLPGFDSRSWLGVGAPKNTPAEIIQKLNTAINTALADPKMKARLADLGATPLVLSSADLGKLIVEETEKWGKVIRAANIKPE
jgi:tripartite-type tricarboxylate transporter receptor subunit TctC